MTNWIALPDDVDTARALVKMLMPETIKYFAVHYYSDEHYNFCGVSIHTSIIVCSETASTISEALAKAVQRFWSQYHAAH